ncbi:hypothetical protein [Methanobrevibacter sp.]|uniref:hypothetical protein n=1 Tax=Methanobrevibacter sp. TaxID=66852 RepID=UPI00388D5DE2
MLTIVGDDEQDIIELPNGMTIHMEFSIDKTGPWGWRGRIKGRYRRIQLYDQSNNLISELIEENPLYQPDVHVSIPEGDKVIY